VALTHVERRALQPNPDEDELRAIRAERLAQLQLKSLSPRQAETVRAAIERNRPTYEALRDR
jgi:hypothetical protein